MLKCYVLTYKSNIYSWPVEHVVKMDADELLSKLFNISSKFYVNRPLFGSFSKPSKNCQQYVRKACTKDQMKTMHLMSIHYINILYIYHTKGVNLWEYSFMQIIDTHTHKKICNLDCQQILRLHCLNVKNYAKNRRKCATRSLSQTNIYHCLPQAPK